MATDSPVKFPSEPAAAKAALDRLALVDGAVRNAPLNRTAKQDILASSRMAQDSINAQDFVGATIQLNNLAAKTAVAGLPVAVANNIQRNIGLTQANIQATTAVQSLYTRQTAWTALPDGLIQDNQLASLQKVTAPMLPVMVDTGASVSTDTPSEVVDSFRTTLTASGVPPATGPMGATGATGPSGPPGQLPG